MDDSITYQWTEALTTEALKAYHKSKVGNPKFIFLSGIFLYIVGILSYLSATNSFFTTFFSFIAATALVFKPIRLHFFFKRLSRDAGKMKSNPEVTVIITDDSITTSSETSTQTIKWSTLDQFKIIDSTLFLWCGKILVTYLPTEPFSESQLKFIELKTKE